jgi:hypothetical protein
MAKDHFVDLMESGGEWWTATSRCINCGYVLDPVLEANRQKQRTMAAMAQTPDTFCISPEEPAEFDIAA